MEVLNGIIPKSLPCKLTHVGKPCNISSRNVSFYGKNYSRVVVTKVGFKDEGHVEYYHGNNVVCGKGKEKKGGWKGVSTKKKMKLLKGLSEDLEMFSELGFGLVDGCDDQGLVGDGGGEKSMIISQAAEVLLAQLKQLRAQEEQMKKEKSKNEDCESSSSSESSDSECDEVVDMKLMRAKAVPQPTEKVVPHSGNRELLSATPGLDFSMSVPLPAMDQQCCNMILDMTLNKDAGIEALGAGPSEVNQLNVGSIGSLVTAKSEGKRIEVCMGGKCKKLGAPALIEEFQRVIGDEGAVVGCKCMGKCKSAPNVKVLNASLGENIGDDSLRTPGNPLYIGVGLEDVELIVANYLGEEMKGMGLSVAGVAS